MKDMGLHEGCIEQMYRMLHDRLLAKDVLTDERGMIRLDDWEMRKDVQDAVSAAWDKISDENLEQLADVAGYWEDFYQMFGFGIPGVDYSADVNTEISVPSIGE